MDELKSYSLTSTEEPTDEQLEAVMLQVGERARESSRKAQAELETRCVNMHGNFTDIDRYGTEAYTLRSGRS